MLRISLSLLTITSILLPRATGLSVYGHQANGRHRRNVFDLIPNYSGIKMSHLELPCSCQDKYTNCFLDENYKCWNTFNLHPRRQRRVRRKMLEKLFAKWMTQSVKKGNTANNVWIEAHPCMEKEMTQIMRHMDLLTK